MRSLNSIQCERQYKIFFHCTVKGCSFFSESKHGLRTHVSWQHRCVRQHFSVVMKLEHSFFTHFQVKSLSRNVVILIGLRRHYSVRPKRHWNKVGRTMIIPATLLSFSQHRRIQKRYWIRSRILLCRLYYSRIKYQYHSVKEPFVERCKIQDFLLEFLCKFILLFEKIIKNRRNQIKAQLNIEEMLKRTVYIGSSRLRYDTYLKDPCKGI